MNLINRILLPSLLCLCLNTASADDYPSELYFPTESGYNHTQDILFPALDIDIGIKLESQYEYTVFFDSDGNIIDTFTLRRGQRPPVGYKKLLREFQLSLLDPLIPQMGFHSNKDSVLYQAYNPDMVTLAPYLEALAKERTKQPEGNDPSQPTANDINTDQSSQQPIIAATFEELENAFKGDQGSFTEILDDILGDTSNMPFTSFSVDEYIDYIAAQILENGFIEEEVAPSDKDPKASVGDPVDVITGNFYSDETDIVLQGPLPLSMSRNYLSSNSTQSALGYGWKPSFMPFLSLIERADGVTVIRAAEFNGTSLTYVPDPEQLDQWIVSQDDSDNGYSDNDGLTNGNGHGALMGNKFAQRIVRTRLLEGDVEQQYFTLYGSKQDVRVYKLRAFPVGEFQRERPYLESWSDAHGNFIEFTFGESPYLNDYGQLVSARASNGNYLNFEYDNAAQITAAYTNDGRRVEYSYDNFGDLRSVVRADGSWIQYTYLTRRTGEGQEYSTHLITEVLQPNGRLLTNAYDSKNRVIEQHATVGEGLELIRNASYYYAHTGKDNAVSGYTKVYDYRAKPSSNPHQDTNCTTYTYTQGNIIQITNTLGHTVEQNWYTTREDYPSTTAAFDADSKRIEVAGNRDLSAEDPGGFPNSLKYSVTKRGLVTYFWYDAKGNVVLTKTFGDRTGDGVAEVVANSRTYNAINLPLQIQGPHMNAAAGLKVITDYDSDYALNPKTITTSIADIPIGRQSFQYGSFSDGGLFANGLPIWIRTGLGADQSHVTMGYDARGFAIEKIQYAATGTADVPVNDAQANELGLLHDERGNLIVVEDFKTGRLDEFQYDLMGRARSAKTYDSDDTLIAASYNYYNKNGELVWVDGQRTGVEDYVYSSYNAAGRLEHKTMWRSQATSDGSGIEAVPLEENATEYYRYDPFGNLIEIIQPSGDYTRLTYDTLGQLLEKKQYEGATDALLATEYYSYEPDGKISTHTNPLGAVTTYTYNDFGQRIAQHNPDGTVLRWQYYLDGSVYKETLANGSYVIYRYGQGADKRQVHGEYFSAAGVSLGSSEQHYDTRGNQVVLIDKLGHRFETTYDGLNRKISATGPAGDSLSAQQATTFTYSDDGLASTQTNALNEKTIVELDILGRLVATKVFNAADQLQRFTEIEYAADFHSQTVISGDGANGEKMIRTRTFTNTQGTPLLIQRLHSTAGDAYDYIVNRYDVNNRLIEAQDELGKVTQMRYDGLSRNIALIRPDGAESRYQYDSAGNLLLHSMPRGLTLQRDYDAIGRVHEEKLRAGSQLSRHFKFSYYDAAHPYVGQLNAIEDLRRNIRTDNTVYDDFARLTQSVHTGAPGIEGYTQNFAYDVLGRMTENTINYTSPRLKDTTVSMTYSPYGQLRTEQTRVNGVIHQSWTQSWDAAGRREQLTSNTPNAVMSYSYGYDPDGRLNSVTDSLTRAQFEFSYGKHGLLQERANPWLSTQVLERDERGHVLQTRTTTRSNPTVNILAETLSWRDDARLEAYAAARTGNFADGRPIWNNNRVFSYNTRNQLTQETFITASGIQNTITYGFDKDKLGVLTSIVRSGNNMSEQHPWRIPNGRLNGFAQPEEELIDGIPIIAQGRAPGASEVMLEVTEGNTTYPLTDIEFDAADANGRWKAPVVLSAGNHSLTATAQHPSGIAEKSVTHQFSIQPGSANDANQRIQSTYDESGYLKTKTLWEGRREEFTWDTGGRLVALKQLNADGLTGAETVYTFDGFGRRLVVERYAIAGGSVGSIVRTERSLYDPSVEFLELGAARDSGAVQWKVYGPDQNGVYGGLQGIGGLVALVDSATNTGTAVVSDALGNVVAAVSGNVSNPTVVWNDTEISGYGVVPGASWTPWDANNTLMESLAWLGYRLDLSGYIWMGARFYDSTSGRFLSPDPLGHAASMDLYSYADGDPINFIDPTGRDSQGNYGEGDPIGKSKSDYSTPHFNELTNQREDSAINNFKDGINDLMDGIKSFPSDFKDGFNELMDGVKSFPSRIDEGFSNFDQAKVDQLDNYISQSRDVLSEVSDYNKKISKFAPGFSSGVDTVLAGADIFLTTGDIAVAFARRDSVGFVNSSYEFTKSTVSLSSGPLAKSFEVGTKAGDYIAYDLGGADYIADFFVPRPSEKGNGSSEKLTQNQSNAAGSGHGSTGMDPFLKYID